MSLMVRASSRGGSGRRRLDGGAGTGGGSSRTGRLGNRGGLPSWLLSDCLGGALPREGTGGFEVRFITAQA
jgi:hypothetical protein